MVTEAAILLTTFVEHVNWAWIAVGTIRICKANRAGMVILMTAKLRRFFGRDQAKFLKKPFLVIKNAKNDKILWKMRLFSMSWE